MRFVCAADCGVDRYGDRDLERAGGIGLNVAVHLRRLCAPGDTVTAVAPVGDDAGQAIVLDAMARTGVEACLEVVAGATPVQHIRHAPGGERVFERYDEGVLAGFRVSERQRAAIAASDVLATAAFGQGLAFFESVMACAAACVCARSTSRTPTTSATRSPSRRAGRPSSTSGCSACSRPTRP